MPRPICPGFFFGEKFNNDWMTWDTGKRTNKQESSMPTEAKSEAIDELSLIHI